jgi:hypothetical protein
MKFQIRTHLTLLATLCLLFCSPHVGIAQKVASPTFLRESARYLVASLREGRKSTNTSFLSLPYPSNLSMDTSRIVITDSNSKRLTPSDEIKAAVESESLSATAIQPLPFGSYHYVKTNSSTDTTSLVRRLASKMKEGFVGPVYLDEFGTPVIVTPEFFVTFATGVSDIEILHFLRSIDADEMDLMTRTRMRSGGSVPMPGGPAGKDTNVSDQSAAFPIRRTSFMRWHVKDGFEAINLTAALARNPIIYSVTANMISQGRAFSENLAAPDYVTFPFNPNRLQLSYGGSDYYLYGAFGVNAPSAWGFTPGSPSVVVAVFDHGVNTGYDNALNDILLVPGFNTTTNPPTVGGHSIPGGDDHGSSVGGFINGVTDRDITSRHSVLYPAHNEFGVAPACPVMPFNSFDDNALHDDAGVEEAIILAQRYGARVSNNSVGISEPNVPGTPANQFVAKVTPAAFRQSQANGMIHFASSGNGGNGVGYPGNEPYMYTVGATYETGAIADYSTYGKGLAFCAPGDNLLIPTLRPVSNSASTWYYGAVSAIGNDSGTSFSSPIAAGIAALVISANPALNTDDVFQIMRATAHGYGTPWDQNHGFGRLDAGAAVERATHFVAADMCIDSNSRRWILSTGFEHRIGFPAQSVARLNVLSASGQVTMSTMLNLGMGWTARFISVGGDGNARLMWTHERDQYIIQIVTPSGVVTTVLTNPDPYWRIVACTTAPDNSFFLLYTQNDGWYYLRKYNADFSAGIGGYVVDPTKGSVVIVNDIAWNPVSNQISILCNDMTDGHYWINSYDSNLAFVESQNSPDGVWKDGFTSAAKLRFGPEGNFRVLYTDTGSNATIKQLQRNGTITPSVITSQSLPAPSYFTQTPTLNTSDYGNGPDARASVKGLALDPAGNASILWNNLTDELTNLSAGTYAAGLSYSSDTPAQMSATTGFVDPTSGWERWAVAGSDSPGYLVYGPYTTQVTADRQRLQWVMSIDNNGGGSSPVFTDRVLTLQVVDGYDNTVLSSRDIYRYDFLGNNAMQALAQGFTLPQSRLGHPLSFQAYWYGNATIHMSSVGLCGLQWSSQSPEIGHQGGSADGADWRAPANLPSPFMLSYGPYESAVQPGSQVATYDLSVFSSSGNAPPAASANPIAFVDVSDYDGNVILAHQDIYASDFRSSNTFQKFVLPFQFAQLSLGHRLEFRVFDYGTLGLKVHAVGVAAPIQ